jgi:predicted HTH domain antitoxin
MSTVQIEIPEETLISLETDPGRFAEELRVLAAVKLFELGRLSSGRAAQLAGMSRVAFLSNLKTYQVSPFQIASKEELQRDIANA